MSLSIISVERCGVRVILRPSVSILARPSLADGMRAFLANEKIDWASDTDNAADALCEFAGRLCYMSFARPRPGGNKAYMEHVIECGHHSVLEHASWSLLLTGISRSLTHELVRHRHFSYSQLSQRYVDSSAVAVVAPPALADAVQADTPLGRGWAEDCAAAIRGYRSALEAMRDAEPRTRKQLHEAARSLLPNATETRIVVTGNARAWRWFWHLRGSEAADAEIRRLAVVTATMLKVEAPALFRDVTLTAAGTVEVAHG